MIIAMLIVFGLCLGSFVNALVWRVYEQEQESAKKKPSKPYLKSLSIARGRSMCPHCKHELGAKDLLPVLSWLSVGGKCRYCHKSISIQYPLVELTVASLFVASYVWWPSPLAGQEWLVFVLWLLLLPGLMALLVYDVRWYLLPNRIMAPMAAIAGCMALATVFTASKPLVALLEVVLAVTVGGGIFYVLFQVSEGRWIGGGDVKLGWLIGLIVATPARSLLFIFLAAILGTIISLPLLASKRLKPTSVIPFGPFLIAAAVIVVLFGNDILRWYQQAVLGLAVY
jgi:prepilin signal peptidase PulO-like enzyme (type II secretory pathway)